MNPRQSNKDVDSLYSPDGILQKRELLSQKYKDLKLINAVMKDFDRGFQSFIINHPWSSLGMGSVASLVLGSYVASGFAIDFDDKLLKRLNNQYDLSQPNNNNETCGELMPVDDVCDDLVNNTLLQACIDIAEALCQKGHEDSATEPAVIGNLIFSAFGLVAAILYFTQFKRYAAEKDASYTKGFKSAEAEEAFEQMCERENIQISPDATIGSLLQYDLPAAKEALINEIQTIERDLPVQIPVIGGLFSAINKKLGAMFGKEPEVKHNEVSKLMPV